MGSFAFFVLFFSLTVPMEKIPSADQFGATRSRIDGSVWRGVGHNLIIRCVSSRAPAYGARRSQLTSATRLWRHLASGDNIFLLNQNARCARARARLQRSPDHKRSSPCVVVGRVVVMR
uniref:Putative secreted protein n=1 Tax=Anopheles darlingi TaxID=43151 RepID=A0A2M4DA47_ANODA